MNSIRAFLRNNTRAWLFVIMLTMAYALVFTFSDFYGMPFQGVHDCLVVIAQWGVVTIATLALLWLLSLNKYVFAVTFPLLTLACSALLYFRYTAHVVLTPMIIDLALVNDWRTSMDVITWQLVLTMLTGLVLSLLAVVYRFRRIVFRHTVFQAVIAFGILFLYDSVQTLSFPTAARLPHVVHYTLINYVQNKQFIEQPRQVFTAGTTTCGEDSLTVVFILGESLRSENLQLNGYERQTTPYLCAERNVVSLRNVRSEEGFTHSSVPMILTRADSLHRDRVDTEKSFIDLLKQAGYHTTWIANQESVSTFLYFMEECDTLVYANSGRSLYVYDKWLDEDMLPLLDERLKEEGRNFILMHSIGSHWYYEAHYPDSMARYEPRIKSRVISSNTHEEMVNSYDNTIVYSDWFWHEVIERLRDRKALLFYLSDHSESLGENGNYTHGVDQEATHHPACWVWYSDRYQAAFPEKTEALKRAQKKELSTSFVFHSLLDAAAVTSPYLLHKESILRQASSE